MPIDPGSTWSPLPESGKQGTHEKTQFIVHSTGDTGTAEAVFRFFSRPDVVVESTFIVGLDPSDPTLQIMNSDEYADANLNANGSAISVEVVGASSDDYTDWQKSEIVRIAKWAMAHHPILPRQCPSPTESGFGWHVMWGAPGPWTPVAKVCPGDLRIQRLQTQVFPAIFANTAPLPIPDVQEDTDMPLLIKNSKGTVALLSDSYVVSLDPASYKGLSANLKTSVVSDGVFDMLVSEAKRAGREEAALAHVDKMVGAFWAAQQKEFAGKTADWDAFLAKLKAALPPVDVNALAAALAAKINPAPAKAAAAKSVAKG